MTFLQQFTTSLSRDLQAETTEVLQTLIRFNTVNPPGDEKAAIDYLDAYVSEAGFETEQLWIDEQRANLVATRRGHDPDGPKRV